MIVAVKFCGGCDPQYDRTGMLNKIKKALGDKVEWTFSSQTPADYLVVINGCNRACADISDFHVSRVISINKNYTTEYLEKIFFQAFSKNLFL
jgi:hypothetical protein